jgi:hypothetical protein
MLNIAITTFVHIGMIAGFIWIIKEIFNDR